MTSGAFWGGTPLDDLAWARRHDPVHWDDAGRVWGVTRYDDVKEISRNIESAAQEMLRWVSPIKNMARTATADTILGGKYIKAGQKLLLLYPSANRDEGHFDQPDVFDIHRQPNDHVAFGFGSHFCLGNNLAGLEITIMLDRLLTRLPDLALASPAEPPRRGANFVSGYESMPVTFAPAAPAA